MRSNGSLYLLTMLFWVVGCLDQNIHTDDAVEQGTDSIEANNGQVNSCPGGCSIDTVCYFNGDISAQTPCKRCDVSRSTTAWSANDGIACDDGVFCNGVDSCDAGSCSVHAEPVCEEGQFCQEELKACCTSNVYAACVEGDLYWFDSCGEQRDMKEDCAPDHSTCSVEDGCGCEAGWVGDNCDTCVLRVKRGLNNYDSADGLSWETAFEHLQEAINAADENDCEVWVAEGLYRPQTKLNGSTDSFRTFQMRAGVHVYGGFQGDELTRASRSPKAHKTELIGSFYNGSNTSGNVFHVVTGTDDSLLDGFTIGLGKAEGGADVDKRGGGLLLLGGYMEIANCEFKGNVAASQGAAIYVESGRLHVRGTQFLRQALGDTAEKQGGAIFADDADVYVADSFFSSNKASRGAAIYAAHGSFVFVVNSVFTENDAAESGSVASVTTGSEINLANSVLTNNKAGNARGQLFSLAYSNLVAGNIVINGATNCTVEDCTLIDLNRSTARVTNSLLADESGVKSVAEDSTAVFAGCQMGVLGVLYEEENATIPLHSCTDLELDCSSLVDTGDNDVLVADWFDLDGDGDTDEPLPYDILGNPRISGGTIDIGAHEFQQ